MNAYVSKTDSCPALNNSSKSLKEISRELIKITKQQQHTVTGGRVFRIRRKRNFCGNIVPQ